MQRQPQASYEYPCQRSNLEQFHGQMEQATPWPELLSPNELSKSDNPRTLAGRESKLDISLNSPWFYLSLILLLGLLLL
jgi:hypothetical protein